ncbi:PREDICTED: cytochrome P450 4C1-like, partial [Wasmannia auropunctata]|uniref:cytochrome P450 4C1-like n=1 Tax=Wasmannia auropunctata TaxID=64793 RepID=UPI0005EFA3D3
MMFITILVLLIIFVVLAYNYYIHYGRNGRLINLLPGPPGYPIVGNAFQYLSSRENQWKYVVTTLTNRYYPIVKIWAIFDPLVTIRHPDHLETILNNTKHIDKSLIYSVFHPWLGTGLLTSGGNNININTLYTRIY